MSVLSTLALLATAVSARIKLDKSHPRFIAGYDAGLKDGRRELEAEAVDYTLLKGLVRSNNELRVKLVEAKRDLAEARRELTRALDAAYPPTAPQPAGPDFRPRGLQQSQAHQQWVDHNAYHQQQNAHLAQQNPAMQQSLQNAQAYGLQNEHGLLGAQSLSALNEMWCNCVPSRAQVWAAHDGDAA